MALPLSGTSITGEAGILRPADATIDFPVVDNGNYAYALQCRMIFAEGMQSLSGNAFGLIGADISYTTDPANG